MKEKEDLRIRKTRATLLSSLSSLMKQKTFDKITITDICKQAKINRSTFYEHYNEKEDLLKDLIIDSTKELENYLVLEKESSSQKENYLSLIELLCTYLEEKQSLFLSFPNQKDVFYQIEEIVENRYYEILERNSKDDKKNNEELASFYIGGAIRLIQNKENYQGKEILIELKKFITDLN